MRITEADLTKSRAEKAAAFMSAYVQAEGRTGEEQDAENAILLLEAYMRRQQVLHAPHSSEAVRAFCGWLMKQAWSE
jgi:hypothetical protein